MTGCRRVSRHAGHGDRTVHPDAVVAGITEPQPVVRTTQGVVVETHHGVDVLHGHPHSVAAEGITDGYVRVVQMHVDAVDRGRGAPLVVRDDDLDVVQLPEELSEKRETVNMHRW